MTLLLLMHKRTDIEPREQSNAAPRRKKAA